MTNEQMLILVLVVLVVGVAAFVLGKRSGSKTLSPGQEQKQKPELGAGQAQREAPLASGRESTAGAAAG